MENAFSIDVEDYFQVNAFADRIKVSDWDEYPTRVVENTNRLIDLLNQYEVKGTFFTLGWVAERFPEIVKRIHENGHEVASHGYNHQLIFNIGPDKFRQDIRESKKRLEDICGQEVIGYRAPTYSITDKSIWAMDILIEEGFRYDSSIFPIAHDTYGIPGAERFPFDFQTEAGGTIREFPLSTKMISFAGKNINFPVAGGGYLRLFPTSWFKRCLKSINEVEEKPFVIYLHPWEIDPSQPRLKGRAKSMLRHYINLDKMYEKTECLLKTFRFAPLRKVLFGDEFA